jgi:hypothetical protein
MLHFLRKHHKKITEVSTGIVLYEIFDFFYNFVFYPIVLAYWGFSDGAVIAVATSLAINIFVFWLYEYMRVDWLGAHALRELEREENKSSIAKLMTWVGKKKEHWWEKALNPIVFIALLLPIDPVIVAIHYRREHFNGLKLRDWQILILATLIANAWWLLKVELVIQALLYLWHLVF